MDYKYIEQLLERYWECQTSMEEEQILRSFFCQKDIPEQLLQYKPLFDYEAGVAEQELGEDFDNRILAMIEQPKAVKIKRLTFKQRMAPLWKAAAVVALIVTVGSAMEAALSDGASDFQGGEGPFTGSTYVRADKVESMYSVEDKVTAGTSTSIDTIRTYQTREKETVPQTK